MDTETLVYLDLEGTPHLVGRLWAHTRKRKESASFEYDASWLQRPDHFSLVLRLYQRQIARFVYVQMQNHSFEEEKGGPEVVVRQGFERLKKSAYATSGTVLEFRQAPSDKSNMAKYLFGGFARCCYEVEKFHSDTERVLAVILDRETEKWIKPAKGQFQIHYRQGSEWREYQPDFVAETKDAIYMLEPKARNQLQDAEVLAKRDAASLWCKRASDHSATCGGKPWIYSLIAHDIVAENKTIEGLVAEAARS